MIRLSSSFFPQEHRLELTGGGGGGGFHAHSRPSESFTITFITFSWKATHAEVAQNEQPEAPRR